MGWIGKVIYCSIWIYVRICHSQQMAAHCRLKGTQKIWCDLFLPFSCSSIVFEVVTVHRLLPLYCSALHTKRQVTVCFCFGQTKQNGNSLSLVCLCRITILHSEENQQKDYVSSEDGCWQEYASQESEEVQTWTNVIWIAEPCLHWYSLFRFCQYTCLLVYLCPPRQYFVCSYFHTGRTLTVQTSSKPGFSNQGQHCPSEVVSESKLLQINATWILEVDSWHEQSSKVLGTLKNLAISNRVPKSTHSKRTKLSIAGLGFWIRINNLKLKPNTQLLFCSKRGHARPYCGSKNTLPSQW